ncbi:isopentenyl-diphosphate Delta-isomerase [Daejeonella sp.]|uniref:isopentenyl-diphosphate Delta-isomerase n=1 Tax=Daejeonella sp. TaxID=2805397 RepID=UPI0030BECC0D
MNENDELIILVDDNDIEIGLLDKTTVHKTGVLHRAFSIFLFNSMGSMMLQRRAMNKYHSPGLWSNTCCSHPRNGERTKAACSRRLMEEMGIKSRLSFAFSFIYKAQLENGLIEHEFDHVYFGFSDKIPKPDPHEVMDWKYISVKELEKDISARPENYTEWLKICFEKVVEHRKR